MMKMSWRRNTWYLPPDNLSFLSATCMIFEQLSKIYNRFHGRGVDACDALFQQHLSAAFFLYAYLGLSYFLFLILVGKNLKVQEWSNQYVFYNENKSLKGKKFLMVHNLLIGPLLKFYRRNVWLVWTSSSVRYFWRLFL